MALSVIEIKIFGWPIFWNVWICLMRKLVQGYHININYIIIHKQYFKKTSDLLDKKKAIIDPIQIHHQFLDPRSYPDPTSQDSV